MEIISYLSKISSEKTRKILNYIKRHEKAIKNIKWKQNKEMYMLLIKEA